MIEVKDKFILDCAAPVADEDDKMTMYTTHLLDKGVFWQIQICPDFLQGIFYSASKDTVLLDTMPKLGHKDSRINVHSLPVVF